MAPPSCLVGSDVDNHQASTGASPRGSVSPQVVFRIALMLLGIIAAYALWSERSYIPCTSSAWNRATRPVGGSASE